MSSNSSNQRSAVSGQSGFPTNALGHDRTGRSVEAWLTDLIAGVVPWLAPIPSAALVANATFVHLEWPAWVAVIAGVVIEGLGLTSTSTALTLWDWNARRPAGEPKAPFWISVLMTAVYFVATIGLTVVLNVDSGLTAVAPAIFPILAVVATVNIALRSQHKHRLERIGQAERERKAEAEQRKAERQAERQLEREAKRQAKLDGMTNEATNNQSIDAYSAKGVESRRDIYEARLTALLDAYRDNGLLRPSDAARKFGVTRQTIDNWKDELEQRGLIHENGNGVEVRQ